MANNVEWLKIKYIGKHEKSYLESPQTGAHWIYTPSGTIGVYMKEAQYPLGPQMRNGNYTFTFVDFVNKVCFEMKIETANDWNNVMDAPKFLNFYILSEYVIVVVAANDVLVTQFVYTIDYGKRTLQLRETIFYEFVKRDYDRYFETQPSRFIRSDGINYLVIIGEDEEIRLVGEDEGSDLITILMIPKYPSQTVAAKEFQVHEEEEHYKDLERRVRLLIGENSERYDEFLFVTKYDLCTICETKLCIRIDVIALREVDLDTDLGTLMGVYLTIDLTKLKEVTNRKITTIQKFNKLREEQGGFTIRESNSKDTTRCLRIVYEVFQCSGVIQYASMRTTSSWCHAYELVVDDVLYLADKTYFWHYEKDIGFLTLFRTNKDYAEDKSMTLFYPSNRRSLLNPIAWSSDSFDEGDGDRKYRYTIHPHEALLNFVFGPNMSMSVRVMKCLKLNLKSPALNKVLFHKDTPIRNHPAYRLCFNIEGPVEYEQTNDVQQALKQFVENFSP